jgi:hypothetical protein
VIKPVAVQGMQEAGFRIQVFITDPNCLTRNDDSGSLLKSAMTFRRGDMNLASCIRPHSQESDDRL